MTHASLHVRQAGFSSWVQHAPTSPCASTLSWRTPARLLHCGYSGLATAFAGIFWPSTTGQPHHLMAFFNSTIRMVSATCGGNSTAFSVAALHQVRAADCRICLAATLLAFGFKRDGLQQRGHLAGPGP